MTPAPKAKAATPPRAAAPKAAASKAKTPPKAAPTKVAAAKVDAKKAPLAKAAPAKAPAAKAPAKKAVSKRTPKGAAGPYAADAKFLEEQTHLLLADRAVYEGQASDLKAEADSLALDREPGDVQFDEESGEGGTVTVDRERDLALSAQATAAVAEIDAALARIADGTYGTCERCHQPIPKARLKALPYARLCVACKSGGLSARR